MLQARALVFNSTRTFLTSRIFRSAFHGGNNYLGSLPVHGSRQYNHKSDFEMAESVAPKELLQAGQTSLCSPLPCMQALLAFCAGGILAYAFILQGITSKLPSEYKRATLTGRTSWSSGITRRGGNEKNTASDLIDWIGNPVVNNTLRLPDDANWKLQNQTKSTEPKPTSAGYDIINEVNDEAVKHPADTGLLSNSSSLPGPL